MGGDKVEAEDGRNSQADTAALDPVVANERADAIDESTDGDGVARFDAKVADPGPK